MNVKKSDKKKTQFAGRERMRLNRPITLMYLIK